MSKAQTSPSSIEGLRKTPNSRPWRLNLFAVEWTSSSQLESQIQRLPRRPQPPQFQFCSTMLAIQSGSASWQA
jgi:hypothetical protein